MSIDTLPTESEELRSWAKLAEAHSEEAKEICEQYGIDLPVYLLGDVLSTIIGDDEWCFGLKDTPFDRDLSQVRKESLLVRLKWEIELSETPGEIRKRLEKFLPIVEGTSWEDEESFLMIKKIWFKNVKNFVQRQIDKNKTYRDAMKYEFKIENIVHPEYKGIILGKLIR